MSGENDGFVKATYDNLPVVDLQMLWSFIKNSDCFSSAKMRNVKTERFV